MPRVRLVGKMFPRNALIRESSSSVNSVSPRANSAMVTPVSSNKGARRPDLVQERTASGDKPRKAWQCDHARNAGTIASTPVRPSTPLHSRPQTFRPLKPCREPFGARAFKPRRSNRCATLGSQPATEEGDVLHDKVAFHRIVKVLVYRPTRVRRARQALTDLSQRQRVGKNHVQVVAGQTGLGCRPAEVDQDWNRHTQAQHRRHVLANPSIPSGRTWNVPPIRNPVEAIQHFADCLRQTQVVQEPDGVGPPTDPRGLRQPPQGGPGRERGNRPRDATPNLSQDDSLTPPRSRYTSHAEHLRHRLIQRRQPVTVVTDRVISRIVRHGRLVHRWLARLRVHRRTNTRAGDPKKHPPAARTASASLGNRQSVTTTRAAPSVLAIAARTEVLGS